MEPPFRVLAIDPGTVKCGIAVMEQVSPSAPPRVLVRAIVPTEEVCSHVELWRVEYLFSVVLCGCATGGKRLAQELRATLPETVLVERVEEAYTSERARKRYWQENPPTGWCRLLPTSLQAPPIPYDDYAAIILAEDWLSTSAEGG